MDFKKKKWRSQPSEYLWALPARDSGKNVWPLHPSPPAVLLFSESAQCFTVCSVLSLPWLHGSPCCQYLLCFSILLEPSHTFEASSHLMPSEAVQVHSDFPPHFLNSSNTYCPHCIHLYLSTLSWLFTHAFVYLLRSSVTACAEAPVKAQAPRVHLSPPSRLSSTWSLHSGY